MTCRAGQGRPGPGRQDKAEHDMHLVRYSLDPGEVFLGFITFILVCFVVFGHKRL